MEADCPEIVSIPVVLSYDFDIVDCPDIDTFCLYALPLALQLIDVTDTIKLLIVSSLKALYTLLTSMDKAFPRLSISDLYFFLNVSAPTFNS